MKRIFSLLLVISCIFFWNTNVWAYTDYNVNNNYENYSITSQGFLLYYDDFKIYHTNDFYQFQYGNNCVPTFAANVLSYYKRFGFDLYDGDITQNMYDEIASLTEYSPDKGAPAGKIYKAIKTYAERAGYRFETDDYLFDLWSDVTRDIKYGYPVLAAYNENDFSHAYMVVGFRVIDGVKQLYVVTNWEYPEYEWLNFDGAGFQMRSYKITY